MMKPGNGRSENREPDEWQSHSQETHEARDVENKSETFITIKQHI